jgi:hypothetical protein
MVHWGSLRRLQPKPGTKFEKVALTCGIAVFLIDYGTAKSWDTGRDRHGRATIYSVVE